MSVEWDWPENEVWGEPDTRRGPADRKAQAMELRTRPGRWARIQCRSSRSAYDLADLIERGRLVAFRPPGTFEVCCIGDYVYARYVG